MLKKIGWVMFFLVGLSIVYLRWWSGYYSAIHTRIEPAMGGLLIEKPDFPIGYTSYRVALVQYNLEKIFEPLDQEVIETIRIRRPLGKNLVIRVVNGRVTDVLAGSLNLFGDLYDNLTYVYSTDWSFVPYNDYFYLEKATNLVVEIRERFRPFIPTWIR